MNFKTTIVLLVLLVIVAVALFFTRQSGEQQPGQTQQKAKVLEVPAADVTRIAYANDEGTRVAFDKSGGQWKLVEPVKAPADAEAVTTLVDTITGLSSKGQVRLEGNEASVTGLDQPRFKVELTTKDGKTSKLDVGSRSGAGGNLYIRREGESQAEVVPAELYDQLDKQPNQWRRDKLFDVSSMDIKQLRVATTQQSYTLEKHGEEWKVAQPTSMPAESSEVSDMTMAVANLKATDWVSEGSADARRYGLDQPVTTVAFSTEAPSTQPTTRPASTQPGAGFTTVQFGRFGDVMKKDVFAATSANPGVVKVSATVLDTFRKTPLDLRDRRILTIDPEKVTKISINSDLPATTQPTTRPASNKTVTIERNKQVTGVSGPLLPVGVAAPATAPSTAPSTAPATTQSSTQPASMPATTQASTQPAEPPSKWAIASSGGANADDSKVDAVLSELNPMRVEKYLEKAPATQPAGQYTITIETTDARHEIRLTDPGNSQPLIGAYNGLIFEYPRFLLEKLEGDFSKKGASTKE